jgi:ATP-dependent RNA helicase MSS116, mitochondrial
MSATKRSVSTKGSVAASSHRRSAKLTSFLSKKRFSSLPMRPETLRAIQEVLKFETMSVPQSQFMPLMLDPGAPDVFVRASTGSGKTLGFLIPAIEVAAKGAGSALILSPARELAFQTLAEAKRLVTFHPGLATAAFVGGMDKRKDVAVLTGGSAPPAIMVATPGRFEDLMGDARVRERLAAVVRTVVLDEADRLLDMGFIAPIQRILASFPQRRTLLFTATVPEEVKKVSQRFMRPGFKFVDTVGETQDQGQITHRAVVAAPRCVHVALRTVLEERRRDPAHKVLVFFPSNQMVELFAAMLPPVVALHGKMPQNVRTRNSEAFRAGTARVMFASDVAGRGMDFPGVTTVVQVGVVTPDVYKQRAGRTGRAGARGESVLVIGTDEERVLTGLGGVIRDVSRPPPCPAPVRGAMPEGLRRQAARAFTAVLGAYKSQLRVLGWTPQQLVDNVMARFQGMGMDAPPAVSDKLLGKMGLRGVVLQRGASPPMPPIRHSVPVVKRTSQVAFGSVRKPIPPRSPSLKRTSQVVFGSVRKPSAVSKRTGAAKITLDAAQKRLATIVQSMKK